MKYKYTIINPRINYNDYTILTCGTDLHNLIARNWTQKELCRFDDILSTHAHNTMHEQMMWEIGEYMRAKRLYQGLYDELIIVERNYQLLKRNRSEMELEFKTLKKRRSKLYNTLVEYRDKFS